MRDFFISRADADAEMAAWIAAELRNLGFTILTHEEKVKDDYERVLAVVSSDYFKDENTKSEWEAANARGIVTPLLHRKGKSPAKMRDLPAGENTGVNPIDLRGRSEEERRFLVRRSLGTKQSARQIQMSNLPAMSPMLFGREAQLKELDGAWISPDVRVVSIVGPIGVGKSALAVNWWLQNQAKGAARVLGWSFYSQGSRADRRLSTDLFLDRALQSWFRAPEPPGSPWDRGNLLAELLLQEPVLLILDELELVQGDLGLFALLRRLAVRNPGLCICTSRIRLPELEGAVEIELGNIAPKDAVEYLRALTVAGSDEEVRQTVREFGTNPLDLTLLGRYIRDAFDGDVRQRTLIPKDGSLAQQVVRLYELLFQDRERQLELMAMRILGLFDRPAEVTAIAMLRRMSFFSALSGDPYWNLALTRVRDARLVSHTEQDATIDCHPLVREHFAKELQDAHSDVVLQARSQLHQFYSKEAPHYPERLEAMAPLFEGVYHGCLAGKHQEVVEKIYFDRVMVGEERLLIRKLGASALDLTLLANLFEEPWSKPLATLPPELQGWLMAEAAFSLRGVGRLRDAAAAMKRAADCAVQQEDWKRAATRFGNLSDLQVTLGDVAEALQTARKAVELADRSEDLYERMVAKTILADALHQSDDTEQAGTLFAEAEALQAERQPDTPHLYSLMGYQYCDLLLEQHRATEVLERAAKMLEGAKGWALDIALARLALGRAHPAGSPESVDHLDRAVTALRQAGTLHHLPRALLARGTAKDLEEVRVLAERCEMAAYL